MNTRLTLIGTPGNWWQNPSGDVTPPELLSATITAAGAEITLVFSEAVTGQTAFTLTSDGGAVTMTGSSGDGTATHVFTLSRTVGIEESITLDYDSVTGTSVDDAANDLDDITAFPVSNGVSSSPSSLLLIGAF